MMRKHIHHGEGSLCQRGNCPRVRLLAHLVSISFLLAAFGHSLRAANTEPTFALVQATSFRSASQEVTLRLQGSFSFDDTLQLGLPLSVSFPRTS